MTALWVAAACAAGIAAVGFVIARMFRDADPLGDDTAFRRAMADPNRDNDRDDLGERR